MIDRTIRFAFNGVVFFGSTILFIASFGRSVSSLINGNAIGEFNFGIISSPIVGFILSTIGVSITRLLILPEGSEYLRPRREIQDDYCRLILEKFSPPQCGIEIRDQIFIIRNIRLLYHAHAALFTRQSSEEAIKFSSRRIDVYNMHVSTATSILLGFVFALFVFKQFQSSSPNYLYTLNWFLYPLIVFYIIAAIRHAARALREANNFEKLHLLSLRKGS